MEMLKDYELTESKCIICNNDSNKNILCNNCYRIYENHFENFNNRNSYKTLNLWFYEDKPFKDNAIKLIAFLNLLESQKKCGDTIDYIIKFFRTINSIYPTLNNTDIRNNWPANYRCEDGHYVRSLSELTIDNWLFNHNYTHAYEKSINFNNENTLYLCDFYLPNEDVYIEFWGIENDEGYERNKSKKINLYDKNKLKRIDLNIKDLTNLDDILSKSIKLKTN